LSKVFTAARAAEFQRTYEALRLELNAMLEAEGVPMRFLGRGSMFTPHFTTTEIRTPADIPAQSKRLSKLFHLESLARGVAMASRGDVFASLAAEERHRDALRGAVRHFAATHRALVRAELGV
jgi:glutamate-1-semialdehyde 2,1-aminomutase